MLAAGALLSLWGPLRQLALPWVLQWLAALFVALTFYFTGRYAVGLVPALAALGGLGIASLADLRREPTRLALRGLVALVPLSLLALPVVRWADRMVSRVDAFDSISRRPSPVGDDAWEQAKKSYLESQAALPDVFWPAAPRGVGLQADEPETARQAAETAVSRYGTSSPVDATLAAGLWAAAGRCDEALALARTAASTGFRWANGDSVIDPRVIASDCLLSLGRRAEAVQELEATNRLAPGRLEVLARLLAAGDTGSATDVGRWERTLFEYHDEASAHYALARARRLWGDAEGALADATWVSEHWPDAAPFSEVERAITLVTLQRPREAVEAWQRSLALLAPVHGQATLDALVASLTQSTDNPAVAALALAHWRMRGDRARVRTILSTHPELAGPRGMLRPPGGPPSPLEP